MLRLINWLSTVTACHRISPQYLLDMVMNDRSCLCVETPATDGLVFLRKILANERERQRSGCKVFEKPRDFFLHAGYMPVVAAAVAVAVGARKALFIFFAAIVGLPMGRILQHCILKRLPHFR